MRKFCLVYTIAHHLDPEIWKMLVRAMFGMRTPNSFLAHDLLAAEIIILFMKLTVALNPNFNAT